MQLPELQQTDEAGNPCGPAAVDRRRVGRARCRCIVFAAGLAALSSAGCGDDSSAPRVWACVIPSGEQPDSAPQIGCAADFEGLASEPLVATLPGARSVKTSIDREA